MQPVLFSLIEAKKGNIGWRRAGTEISYFRNLFKIPNDDERKENKKIGKNVKFRKYFLIKLQIFRKILLIQKIMEK